MKSKSVKGKSTEEIQTALQQSMADGFKPTLAIVFLSVKQDREAICELLNSYNVAIYGATTNGEFIDDEYETGTIAMLLLDINPAHFFIGFAVLNGIDDRDITARIAGEALKKFNDPAFLITASHLHTDVDKIIAGFTDVAGKNVNAFGGMAGDDLSFSTQYVFTNHTSGNRAIVVLVFDQDKIIMKGCATHGWKAVGTDKTITRAEGNRVYTIENMPALDLCLKYSGLNANAPNLPMELSMNCPLQLQQQNGDPLMRPAFMINREDGSLITSGSLAEGSKIRFSLPPDFDMIETVIAQNKNFKETVMQEADALIIYNCGGRLMCFGPLIGEEIKGIQKVWNIPMAGMFSNAEIGRTPKGNVEMHNLTTCWVALKEK